MKITKSYKVVKTYEIRYLFPKTLSWRLRKLKEVNKKVQSKCLVCNHKFGEDEEVYLASIAGTTNKLICSSCWDKINEKLNSEKNENK